MMALIGGLLLAAGVVLFIVEPVFSGQRALVYRGDDEHDDSLARRRIALTALRDLEYDRATGKVDGKDYERLKTELSQEALRHLPEAAGASESDSPAPGPGREVASTELEDEIARIRAALEEGMQCEGCQRINTVGSHFCGGCGRPLHAVVEASP